MENSAALVDWSKRIVACLDGMNALVESKAVSENEARILTAFMTDGLYFQEGIRLSLTGEQPWTETWQTGCEDYVVRMENMLDRIRESESS